MIEPGAASTVFLEGPVGAGKTTFALRHLETLLADGVPAETIMILVPQRSLSQPYERFVRHLQSSPGVITMATLSGLARRNLDRFWPLIASVAGYDPVREPVFLTIETAQYYMMRFVRPAVAEGIFDSIGLPPSRIAAQLLDNMAKAAIAGFPFAEVCDRLIAAWGDRQSSRLQVYRTSQTLSAAYRAFCQEHNLLDYALQLEVFWQYLVPHPIFRRYFVGHHQHLIADNIEESGPLAHDFISSWWDQWHSALLVMDSDGGYRTFLGASPESAVGLRNRCAKHLTIGGSFVCSDPLLVLDSKVRQVLSPHFMPVSEAKGNLLDGLSFEHHAYYPQMIDWVVGRIVDLVVSGTPPREIAVLTPFLSDSLRFSLQSRLESQGISTMSQRPSRALRDEPSARVMFTLLQIAHPQWGFPAPPHSDIVDVFVRVIDNLDPVRARLLADIVYKPNCGGALSSFDQIQTSMRERISYTAGERYEYLRGWLEAARETSAIRPSPPDYFFSRLFGEVLSQPGFGFHARLDDGRIAAQIIESARKFRQALYPYQYSEPDWNAVGQEYLTLVNEGVLAALYMPVSQREDSNAVLLAPAFTFLMRNAAVDYQFWLDVGSDSWWKRLDQPLTHPYVLTRYYPIHREWTEQDEVETQREVLFRLMIGLIRRTRRHIYLGISDLGEQGYEQRGPMLYVFQQILQRLGKEGQQ